MERDQFNQVGGAELRRILALATEPDLPEGASERLLALAATGAPNVVGLRPAARNRAFGYAALPLAASLLLGIYLGAMGNLDWLLPDRITGEVADSSDAIDDLGGVGEAEEYVEDNLT